MELNKKILIERLSSKLDVQGVFLYDSGVGEEVKAHLMKILKYPIIE